MGHMAQQYTDEIKAQVIAEWELGTSQAALARKHNIPRSTVRLWTAGQEPIATMTATQKREDLGELVFAYLAEGLRTLRTQAAAMGDSEWFKVQPGTQHLIHGVLADKLVIIFGGVERGTQHEPEPGADS